MKEHLERLLDQYSADRRREAQATDRSDEYADAARSTADELRRLWAAEGEDPSELEKLLRRTEFRERVLGLYDGPAALADTDAYGEATKRQEFLTRELREFWLSSGHDLKELQRFESAVDEVVYSLIVK